jgi:UrcA family protein
MMTRTLILALSFAAAVVPAAAQAEGRTATVRIDDLDLTRATDRERLDTRLKSAARSVCRTNLRRAGESSRQAACLTGALAQAEPQVAQAIAEAQDGTRLALLMIGTTR